MSIHYASREALRISLEVALAVRVLREHRLAEDILAGPSSAFHNARESARHLLASANTGEL